MKTPIVILALLGTAISVTADPLHPLQEIVAYFGEYCGTNYAQKVFEKDLGHFVEWDPETEPCPLPMSNAIALASAALPTAFPKSEWRFGRVAVSELQPGLWHYLVYLRLTKPKGYGYFHVIVSPTGWTPPFEFVQEEELPGFPGNRLPKRTESKESGSEQPPELDK